MSDIDDKVDEWHDNPELEMPLHEYLGMSWVEFVRWVEDDGEV